MNSRYPIYVISKGRWDSRMTVRALTLMNVSHRVVIEPQEREAYAAVMDPASLLVLPFSNLGLGSIPVRNWVWEHSIAEGHTRHWVLDDNIKHFGRLYRNKRYRVTNGATFAACEDFVDRYANVAMAGMQYRGFVEERSKHAPFALNTRIYSCILLDNALPHRWRGRYNEDTDLSIRLLKDGYCTILFYAFFCDKAPTMTVKGGNTESLYKLSDGQDGRLLMAQSLQQQHPDVVKITRKWGRWQHSVDYRPFKGNRLIRRSGVEIPQGANEYGMVLTSKP